MALADSSSPATRIQPPDLLTTRGHGRLLAGLLRLLRRVFKAFQYRDFRLMFIGACASSIGTWMQITAQSWLIYRLSHSTFYLGLDQFLGGIPIFLFSLIGGVVADRVERRRILLGSQYVQMASAAILTVLVATGTVHVWHILCLSFLSGLAQAFGGPAYLALIPTLVKKEDMPNAIALNSIQFNVAVVLGAALGGQAVARLGETWCFGLNTSHFWQSAAIASRSAREKTVPVGLLGLQRMIALVLSLKAAASSSRSNRQSGGRIGTNRADAPAITQSGQ